MNKRVMLAALLVAVAAGGGLSYAQAPTVAGEVIKIDKAAGRLTLKHGEIKTLDMPPMTMVWRVKSPGALNELAVGDRVRFVPERIDGQYTITSINKAAQ
jgi:Cu(I)/Ag(I) efflux system protein CusF